MRVLVLLFVISSFPFVQQLNGEAGKQAPFTILREVPLTIYSEKPTTMSISLYNVTGEQVLYREETLSEPGAIVVEYDWGSLEAGIYYVNIHNGSYELLTKLIIRGS